MNWILASGGIVAVIFYLWRLIQRKLDEFNIHLDDAHIKEILGKVTEQEKKTEVAKDEYERNKKAVEELIAKYGDDRDESTWPKRNNGGGSTDTH